MPEPTLVDLCRDTGLPVMRSFRHSHPVVRETRLHGETDLILYRVQTFGAAERTTYAERSSDGPDLLFLSRGSGLPAAGRMAGTPFERRPNTDVRATYVPYGADSSITYGVGADSTNLVFPRGYLAQLMAGQSHGSFAPLLFNDDERLARLIRLLEAEIVAPGFASRLLVDGISRAIATLLVRLNPVAIGNAADRIHMVPRKLRRVLEFVDANLDQDIGLDDLARIAELSPFHFSRVFKLATGSSPYHYVRDRRLKRARLLLAEGRLGIAELALACGFANQSHFTAAFTKAMGVSPGRFRRQTAV